MKKLQLAAAMLAAQMVCSPAWAGLYADDLSRCLVQSATPEDKAVLIKWIFANISLNPLLGFSGVSEAERTELSKKTSQIMERTTLSQCHAQAVAALKYEGPPALEASDRVLGSTAAQGLLNDAKVQTGLMEISHFLDQQKWVDLYAEAGIQRPVPATAPKP